ncbi:aminotransferase class I/II-fold pyridoxal phosphate-dependent enzyme, partial [Tissierellaceae bacterium HCP3S3_D8]
LTKIGELCVKHKVVVFNDEIHADIVYSKYKHIPFASISSEIADITITSLNPGKTFNVAGVRTAAVIISNEKLREKFIISRKNNKAMGRTIFGQNVFIACY